MEDKATRPLTEDDASQHPDIKKPFTEKLLKDLEFGIHLLKQDNGK